jgi:hypothetical protein
LRWQEFHKPSKSSLHPASDYLRCAATDFGCIEICEPGGRGQYYGFAMLGMKKRQGVSETSQNLDMSPGALKRVRRHSFLRFKSVPKLFVIAREQAPQDGKERYPQAAPHKPPISIE